MLEVGEMCIGEVWVHAADVLTQIRTENAVFSYGLAKIWIWYVKSERLTAAKVKSQRRVDGM